MAVAAAVRDQSCPGGRLAVGQEGGPVLVSALSDTASANIGAGRVRLALAHGSSGAASRSCTERLVRVIAMVAKVIDAPMSSTSSTIRERFSPSGDSHRSVHSRPATTTRAPLASDSVRFSASCRKAVQSRNVVSPFCQAFASRSKVLGVDATVNRATGTPLGVKRSSGSSTRFPIKSLASRFACWEASHIPPTFRQAVEDRATPRICSG